MKKWTKERTAYLRSCAEDYEDEAFSDAADAIEELARQVVSNGIIRDCSYIEVNAKELL